MTSSSRLGDPLIKAYLQSRAKHAPTLSDLRPFAIPAHYDYNKSTEMNYYCEHSSYCASAPHLNNKLGLMRKSIKFGTQFYGKYIFERQQMDSLFHKVYSKDRQLYQDEVIDLFLDTLVMTLENGVSVECDTPEKIWVVFTAGAMGVGKSYAMEWLSNNDLFPLHSFVQVDLDMIRNLLPENNRYRELNPIHAGDFTQKEAGYIAEILSLRALRMGKNILVHGSLRNSAWHAQYIGTIRSEHEDIKIGIIHIGAPLEAAIERAKHRGEKEGRQVPAELIRDSFFQVNESLRILTPLTNFVASFENADDSHEPQLLYITERTTFPQFSELEDIQEDEEGHIFGALSPKHLYDKLATDASKYFPDEGARVNLDEDWRETFRGIWNLTCRFILK